MKCTNGHGEMKKYDESSTREKYVCNSCGLKVEANKKKGVVVEVAAIVMAVVGIIINIL